MQWVQLFVLVGCILSVTGHAYLSHPKSRNKLYNEVGKEDCPHCLPAGGPGTVGKLAGGVFPSSHDPVLEEKRHGMCGDSLESSSPKYNPFPVSNIDATKISVFKKGQSVTFEVVMTTHHYGHFEFFLCDTKDLTDPAKVTQECLFKHILQRDPANQGTGDNHSPIDPKYPERYYIIPKCLGSEGGSPRGQIHKASYLLPSDLECDHCILQWWWATANSCSPPGYDTYSWPANPSDCTWYNPATHDLACGSGGYPEEFWNCADIQITADGTGTGIPAPPPMAAWEVTLLDGFNNLRDQVTALPALGKLMWSVGNANEAKSAGSCATDASAGRFGGSGGAAAVLQAWSAQKSDYKADDGTCSGECKAYRQIMSVNSQTVGCAQLGCGIVCKFAAVAPMDGKVYSPATGRICVSKQAHISDEWCRTVKCGPDYSNFCEYKDAGGSPNPSPPNPSPPNPSPPNPSPPNPSPPSPPSPPGVEMTCKQQKEACQTRCIKVSGGVKTNQCWGEPSTYVECRCSDETVLKIKDAPACKHSSCTC